MVKITSEKIHMLNRIVSGKKAENEIECDDGLLNEILDVPFTMTDEGEKYPTKAEKAAALGYELIRGKVFSESNARIGMYVMLIFLETNGIRIKCENEELTSLGYNVYAGKADIIDIADWINGHS